MQAEATHQTTFNDVRTKQLMDEHGLTGDGGSGFPSESMPATSTTGGI